MTKLYAEISKTEEQDDGTIKVWGYASSEAVDSDGEVITADAMKAAIPDYMRFGAVREQHDSKKAAGTAIEAEVQDDGRTWFGAHVVDPVAVKKVKTGTYKGFSIGGRATARDKVNKSVITGLNLIEVSLVDRPANPEAVFECFKAETLDDATEQPADEVKKGLYELSDFASVLRGISYLAASAEFEAQSEGDGSPLPAELRTWLAMGVEIFQAMAKEECAEMLAQLNAMAPAAQAVEVVTLAEGEGDLAKAGARFSGATKAALKAAHDACKAADKALADLGYDKDGDEGAEDGDSSKAAQDEDLTKAATVDELAEFVKAAGVSSGLELLKGMAAEIERLKAEPAAPKGYANAQALSKADDRGDLTNDPEPVRKADGSTDDVATLIKVAQAKPIRIV